MERIAKPGQSIEEKNVEQKSLDEPNGESSEPKTEQCIHYLQAKQLLDDRLKDVTPEEIAIWRWFGPDDGGLSVYDKPQEGKPLQSIYSWCSMNPDYISPLMECWFKINDINNFQPADRYITSPNLVKRWRKGPIFQTETFIKERILSDDLVDLHPHTGHTRWTGDNHFPDKRWAIFSMSQVRKIEADYILEQKLIPQPEVDRRRGVHAPQIIEFFSFWDATRWKALLSRPSPWLQSARVAPIIHRKAAFWNPAVLANCLWAYRLKHLDSSNKVLQSYARTIPAKMQLKKILKENFIDWLEDWQPDLD